MIGADLAWNCEIWPCLRPHHPRCDDLDGTADLGRRGDVASRRPHRRRRHPRPLAQPTAVIAVGRALAPGFIDA